MFCATIARFQSTLPQGERHFSKNSVSIHQTFQSTLPQGERQDQSELTQKVYKFQSTLPQGERQDFKSGIMGYVYFNPRSHKGSDSNISQKNLFIQWNIIKISKFVLKIFHSFIFSKQIRTFLFIIFGANLPAVLCALYTRTNRFHKIRVWSAAIPLSTPICSTFVWYLFPR